MINIAKQRDNTSSLRLNFEKTPYSNLSVALILQDYAPIILYWPDISAAIIVHAILYPQDDYVRIAHRLNITPEHTNWIMSQNHNLHWVPYRKGLRRFFESHRLIVRVGNSLPHNVEYISTLGSLEKTLSRLQIEAFNSLSKPIKAILNHIQYYPHHTERNIAADTSLNMSMVNQTLQDYSLLSVDGRRNYAFFKRLEAPNRPLLGVIDDQSVKNFIEHLQEAGYGKRRIRSLLQKELGVNKSEFTIRSFMASCSANSVNP